MASEENLQHLEQEFLQAMALRQAGNVTRSEEILLAIVQNEPRLPEPHIELAHIYLLSERHEDSLNHIQEAIQYLENGGQWLEMEEGVLLSLAYTIQGEIYQIMADQDDVVFGEPEAWKSLIAQSKQSFIKAAALDANNKDVAHKGSEHAWKSSQPDG